MAAQLKASCSEINGILSREYGGTQLLGAPTQNTRLYCRKFLSFGKSYYLQSTLLVNRILPSLPGGFSYTHYLSTLFLCARELIIFFISFKRLLAVFGGKAHSEDSQNRSDSGFLKIRVGAPIFSYSVEAAA